VSSANQIDRHDITEILLKDVLNTIILTLTLEPEYFFLPKYAYLQIQHTILKEKITAPFLVKWAVQKYVIKTLNSKASKLL
jgi:hypothetical protein